MSLLQLPGLVMLTCRIYHFMRQSYYIGLAETCGKRGKLIEISGVYGVKFTCVLQQEHNRQIFVNLWPVNAKT